MSCGSFRGEHWRYLPIRNHDNRYFADWIRLCPGLSKNSENGNSCPKPHKAARMIEAVGRAVSIETETIIAIWILSRRSSRLYKGKMIIWRPKWTERVACKIGMRLLAPKTKQSYLFLAPLHSGLGKAVVAIYPGRAMQWDALAFLPHPTDITDIPPPSTTRLHSLWSASLSSGSDQHRIRGCGTRWLLAGPDSLPLWLCRVSMVYVVLCCWGVFPVLTLYSPRSIVWGLFFFSSLSSLSSCLCCIFLQFYLHFTTDYTLYDCVCDE